MLPRKRQRPNPAGTAGSCSLPTTALSRECATSQGATASGPPQQPLPTPLPPLPPLLRSHRSIAALSAKSNEKQVCVFLGLPLFSSEDPLPGLLGDADSALCGDRFARPRAGTVPGQEHQTKPWPRRRLRAKTSWVARSGRPEHQTWVASSRKRATTLRVYSAHALPRHCPEYQRTP